MPRVRKYHEGTKIHTHTDELLSLIGSNDYNKEDFQKFREENDIYDEGAIDRVKKYYDAYYSNPDVLRRLTEQYQSTQDEFKGKTMGPHYDYDPPWVTKTTYDTPYGPRTAWSTPKPGAEEEAFDREQKMYEDYIAVKNLLFYSDDPKYNLPPEELAKALIEYRRAQVGNTHYEATEETWLDGDGYTYGRETPGRKLNSVVYDNETHRMAGAERLIMGLPRDFQERINKVQMARYSPNYESTTAHETSHSLDQVQGRRGDTNMISGRDRVESGMGLSEGETQAQTDAIVSNSDSWDFEDDSLDSGNQRDAKYVLGQSELRARIGTLRYNLSKTGADVFNELSMENIEAIKRTDPEGYKRLSLYLDDESIINLLNTQFKDGGKVNYKQGGALKGLMKKYGAGGSVDGWGAQGNFSTEYNSRQPEVEELPNPNAILTETIAEQPLEAPAVQSDGLEVAGMGGYDEVIMGSDLDSGINKVVDKIPIARMFKGIGEFGSNLIVGDSTGEERKKKQKLAALLFSPHKLLAMRKCEKEGNCNAEADAAAAEAAAQEKTAEAEVKRTEDAALKKKNAFWAADGIKVPEGKPDVNDLLSQLTTYNEPNGGSAKGIWELKDALRRKPHGSWNMPVDEEGWVPKHDDIYNYLASRNIDTKDDEIPKAYIIPGSKANMGYRDGYDAEAVSEKRILNNLFDPTKPFKTDWNMTDEFGDAPPQRNAKGQRIKVSSTQSKNPTVRIEEAIHSLQQQKFLDSSVSDSKIGGNKRRLYRMLKNQPWLDELSPDLQKTLTKGNYALKGGGSTSEFEAKLIAAKMTMINEGVLPKGGNVSDKDLEAIKQWYADRKEKMGETGWESVLFMDLSDKKYRDEMLSTLNKL